MCESFMRPIGELAFSSSLSTVARRASIISALSRWAGQQHLDLTSSPRFSVFLTEDSWSFRRGEAGFVEPELSEPDGHFLLRRIEISYDDATHCFIGVPDSAILCLPGDRFASF